MRNITAVSAALLITGCATGALSEKAPYYDHQSNSVIASGFPVSRISPPDRFAFQRNQSEDGSRDHASHDGTSARTSTHTFAWASSDNSTAVMTALFESLDRGSRFLPQNSSSGYEFKDGQRFIYNERWGRYGEMAGDRSAIPSGAPECAATVDLLAVSDNERRRFIGVYTEGVSCDEVNRLSSAEWEQLRQRAFDAYGISG